jgi:hypothetical protein
MFFLEDFMQLRQWFSDRLPNPRSSIEEDVRNLLISFIYEYYIKYNRFVTVVEIWKMFQKHPSIKNDREYILFFLLILGNYKANATLYLDAAHNIIQTEPE